MTPRLSSLQALPLLPPAGGVLPHGPPTSCSKLTPPRATPPRPPGLQVPWAHPLRPWVGGSCTGHGHTTGSHTQGEAGPAEHQCPQGTREPPPPGAPSHLCEEPVWGRHLPREPRASPRWRPDLGAVSHGQGAETLGGPGPELCLEGGQDGGPPSTSPPGVGRTQSPLASPCTLGRSSRKRAVLLGRRECHFQYQRASAENQWQRHQLPCQPEVSPQPLWFSLGGVGRPNVKGAGPLRTAPMQPPTGAPSTLGRRPCRPPHPARPGRPCLPHPCPASPGRASPALGSLMGGRQWEAPLCWDSRSPALCVPCPWPHLCTWGVRGLSTGGPRSPKSGDSGVTLLLCVYMCMCVYL